MFTHADAPHATMRYAQEALQSDLPQPSALWGFTEVGEIVFDQASDGVVIDPTEERLREEFANTKVLHLPIQCIVRVEEVEKRGPLAIRDAASGEKVVTPFPMAPPQRK